MWNPAHFQPQGRVHPTLSGKRFGPFSGTAHVGRMNIRDPAFVLDLVPIADLADDHASIARPERADDISPRASTDIERGADIDGAGDALTWLDGRKGGGLYRPNDDRSLSERRVASPSLAANQDKDQNHPDRQTSQESHHRASSPVIHSTTFLWKSFLLGDGLLSDGRLYSDPKARRTSS
ncbi:MAG: hypothetical protein OZSIB_0899 [Candidatus Ozemobacter sibiricus]|uniref:Uncharacterized protein n=1 Tax=Candidatus Ozemobacter sibiricus TaxID=2268124 RepID=A0A367ZUE2_9BACT|nr:MAG: hypothetical protein OZSIB_0899 [Candidatus Ozemobacter sibiricus]